jgi:signal transduction histidine kinase
MNDGAALLTLGGVTLFCNRRLGEIARAPIEDVRGSRFESLVSPTERSRLRELMQDGAGANRAGEFTLPARGGPGVPVWIALSSVPLGTYPAVTDGDESASTVFMAIVTDLTERKEAATTRLELMGRVISAEDDERRRIAQELHDETGQSLTALLVGLRAIEALAVTDAVHAAALRLHEITAATMDNVGRLARGLHPSVLDDIGLAAAARRFVKDYSESFDIAVDLDVEDFVSRDVAPLAQTTLYRILQEALTNVARHARARSVRVELKAVRPCRTVCGDRQQRPRREHAADLLAM